MNAASPQLTFDYSRRPRANRVAFWNTTSLHGEDLDTAKTNARRQDVLVLSILRGCAGAMTPSEVWRAAREAGSDLLLTSVRRSMHTLTRDGLLAHLDDKRMGPFGRPEGLWRTRECANG